jgi:hypothetical protein
MCVCSAYIGIYIQIWPTLHTFIIREHSFRGIISRDFGGGDSRHFGCVSFSLVDAGSILLPA